MSTIIVLLVAAAAAGLLVLQWRRAVLVQRAEATRAALVDRLADRFDGPEFIEFARSPEGRLLLGAGDPATATGRRLLLMAQAALLLAALGAGFLVTGWGTPPGADINLVREAEEARYWGTLCLALAAGFGAAFLLCRSQARAWGLIPK